MASLLTRVFESKKGPSTGRSTRVVSGALYARARRGASFGGRRFAGGRFAYAAIAFFCTTCSRNRNEKPRDAARVEAGSPGAPTAASAAVPSRSARADDAAFPLDAGKLGLKLDKTIELGPAGAVVATPLGALFHTRADELVGFLLGASTSSLPKRIGGREDGLDPEGDEALGSRAPPAAYTRGSYAYWVTGGKLVRRGFPFRPGAPAGALEVLATDALDGTRVAAATATAGGRRRDIALYIARAEKQSDERGARIWAEGAGSAVLSSEGSGASSVALAASDAGWVAVMLDLRSAMSPVHARTVELGESGPPRLGPDVVVFIGPSPEGRSEVAAAASSDGPIAFVPFAPDTSSFGLASLLIGAEPHLDATAQWRMYPNGLEPAPVAAAVLCGRTWVAYARPSAALPASPQVVALAPIERGAFGPELTAAQGFDFMSISLAPRDDGGAWLTWVGNGRSWIRAVRCG
jgi:hypothetical protein